MKLFLVSQDIGPRYDIYDAIVVAAESSDDARTIHPVDWLDLTDGFWTYTDEDGHVGKTGDFEWLLFADRHLLEVEYLGETTRERGVVLASMNAG